MSGDLQRAEMLIDLHRPDDALALATSAAERDPEAAEPHIVAARAHLKAERPVAAEGCARQALSLDPESASATLLRAIAAGEQGNTHRARKLAGEALRRAPYHAPTHALLGQYDSLIQLEAEGIARCEHAVHLAPDEPFCHLSLGVVLYRDGRYRGSEQALRRALELDPTDAVALTALGDTLAALGRPGDAAELLQLAARNDVRDDGIRQDMLRYVRRAAGGLGTWPIIAIVCWATLLTATADGNSATNRVVLSSLFGALALVLGGARTRRMRRFPKEVRRMLNRRSLRRSAIEFGGPAGWRPWWWRVIVRLPVSARALSAWLIWLSVVGSAVTDGSWRSDDWVPALLFAGIPGYLTYLWLASRRKARASHPLYEPSGQPGPRRLI